MILLCRLGEGMVHKGKWTLPGGGQNFGETLEQTVAREVLEETGFTVHVGSLVSHGSVIWQAPEKDIHSFQFLFSATVRSGEITHEIGGSTDHAAWVELESISCDNAVDIVLRAKEIATLPSLNPGVDHYSG